MLKYYEIVIIYSKFELRKNIIIICLLLFSFLLKGIDTVKAGLSHVVIIADCV